MLRCALVLSAACLAAAPAQARLFWQSYGSTAPAPAGCGCAWNLNSDYFVPRACDSCRYGLFSPCKKHHSISPACKSLHPVYTGYCTPYGPCHYKFRDHLYAKRCGCTPLACVDGPWQLAQCAKHGGCGGAYVSVPGHGCGPSGAMLGPQADPHLYPGVLPNVEPLGGETLGTILAYPTGLGAGQAAVMMPAMGAAVVQPVPAVPVAPVDPLPDSGGAAYTIPGMFGG